MELDGNLFSATYLWWLGIIQAATLIMALRLAAWKHLSEERRLHAFLGSIVALILLWHLRGEVLTGISFHMLGVTTLTLMFGWSLAVIGASIALLAVSINVGYGWEGFVASMATVVLAPVSLTQLFLVLIRSWLPKHFFIYILGNAFLTGWGVAYLSGYLAVALVVTAGFHVLTDLENTIMPFFMLMFFPEAIINGWIMTILVLYCPAWVYSFEDEKYLHGK